MTSRKVKDLQPGDQVYWSDPDDGLCSRMLTIQSIEVEGNIVCITDINNGYLECFPEELS